MLKLHQAKMNRSPQLELWGTGKPLREFLYSDDLADGLIHVLKNYSYELPLNIGSGQEVSILDLAMILRDITGYQGEIVFNANYPDGTLRKRLDCSRLEALGWKAGTPLQSGLEQTYQWFLEQYAEDQAA
jgi:GDP-L-fucose synthase